MRKIYLQPEIGIEYVNTTYSICTVSGDAHRQGTINQGNQSGGR